MPCGHPVESITPGLSVRSLGTALTSLLDTFGGEFDLVDLCNRLAAQCVRLLAVPEVLVLLAAEPNDVVVATAAGPSGRALAADQLDHCEGPAVDCLQLGVPAPFADLADPTMAARWPWFAAAARARGFQAGHAVPLRQHQRTVGALVLLRTEPGAVDEDALAVAVALAEVATAGVLAERAVREQRNVAAQLQAALSSRVIIEQAKGMLAERGRISPDAAFELLRRHARGANQRLGDLARAVVDGKLDTGLLVRGGAQTRPSS
jgi:GAF domain-containing protein